MKQYLSRIIASLALIVALVFPTVALAAPVDVIDGKNDACKGSTAVCGNNGAKLFDIIQNVINVLLYAIGILAVILIVIGGLKYVLSNGDQAQVTSAKNTILYSVVGLVIASLAYAIVNFVVARVF